MQKKTIFIVLGIFWLIIIGGFIGIKEYTLRTGQEILLKTRPVDPRDFFRGDYVVLNYDISSLDLETITADRSTFAPGDKVFVALGIKDSYAVPLSVYGQRPKVPLYMQGTVVSVSDKRLRVEYGIESYFVPEGEGRVIEQARGKSADVRVRVGRSGKAMIQAVRINGQEVKF